MATRRSLAAKYSGNGKVTLSWKGFTPIKLARNGVDSGGTGPWDTDMLQPPGVSAAAVSAAAFEFTALVPGSTYLLYAYVTKTEKLTKTFKVPASTPPPPPPPPVTPTFTAHDDGGGKVTVSWTNMAPTKLGRDGVDSSGHGPWDTDMYPPTGVPAANLLSKSFQFTSLVAGTKYTFTATYPGGVMQAVVTVTGTPPVTPPPPPPPVPAGHLLFGIGSWNTRQATTDFEATIGHKVSVNSCYVGANAQAEAADILESPSRDVLGWLRQDPKNLVTFGWRPLIGMDGQFENLTADNNGVAFASYVQRLGIAGQVVCKPNYEMNADWFEAGRNQSGNLHGVRQVAQMRRIIPKMKAVAPALRFEWCPVLGNSPSDGSLPEEFYWGDDMVDFISGDTYDVYVSGSPAERWNGILAQNRGISWQVQFAAAHSKQPAIGEWALWNPNTNPTGGGDNPYYVTHLIQWCIDHNYAYMNWLNNDESNEILSNNPQSVQAFRAIAATVV